MTTKKMYIYTRDTLLAFASLPSCQPRPDGIDPCLWRDSITSDVVERNIAIPVVPSARGLVRRDSDVAYSNSPVDDIPEWRRPNGGGAILQTGPRRKPYEEEPVGNAFAISYPPRPTGPWVEQNGPVRPPPHDRPGPNGPPGRWDRNGRLSQDWDAEEGGPGGRGDAGPRPWVERDGLLGSGNRPPPQAHARVGRPVDNYQPSRPLIKTPMYGRREDTDNVNDETFGFLESSVDDRSDQERKRREAFEMMRKEQHKQLQEHKNPVKSENSTVNRKHDENSLWDNPSHQSPPLSPIGKTVVLPVPTPPRPAVPPGFSKVAQHRFNANQSSLQQEDDAEGSSNPLSKDALVRDQALLDSDKTDDSSSAHSSSSLADIKEVKCATVVAKEMIIELDVVETKGVVVTEGKDDIVGNGSRSSGEILSGKRMVGVPDMWSFSLEGQDGDSISDIQSTEDAGSVRKDSLLDKLFGSAPPTIINDVVLPSDLLRDEPLTEAPAEDTWSGSLSKTSKFAHWFNAEEDKFTTSQTSSAKNLMSLFGSSELADKPLPVRKDIQSSSGLGSTIKPGFSVALPMPVGPSLEDIEKSLMREAPNNGAPKNGFISHHHHKPPSTTPPKMFMTCEDIEQAMLAEAQQGSDPHQLGRSKAPPVVAAAVEPPPKDAASASQHLLALLLKRPPSFNGGLEMEDAAPPLDQSWKKPESTRTPVNEVHTLESLFGKAFMNELQAPEQLPVPAPVSFSEESGPRKSESLNSEDVVYKARSSGMDDWHGPGWNSMWPDSKDVEAGSFHLPKESHPVPEEFEVSAPPMPAGLWSNNTDVVKTQNHACMDSLNGATPHFGVPPEKQQHHNDGVVKKSKPFPGAAMQQHMVPQRPLGNTNSFPHPALRPQGLDLGFDAFTAPLQQPPSLSFHGHGPNQHHMMAQPQILQRPQFHYSMVMQEQQDVIKPQQQPPAHHLMQQHQPNAVPPGAFMPFQSEFQRPNIKSTSTGAGYGGAVERWIGMEGRRGGLMGPAGGFPQAPLGVEGDINLRYG